jgi:hypothetical protein
MLVFIAVAVCVSLNSAALALLTALHGTADIQQTAVATE